MTKRRRRSPDQIVKLLQMGDGCPRGGGLAAGYCYNYKIGGTITSPTWFGTAYASAYEEDSGCDLTIGTRDML